MRVVLATIAAVLAGVALAIAAVPAATVDQVTQTSITFGSLKCGKDYRFRIWERNASGVFPKNQYQQVIKTTDACAPPTTTTTTTPPPTTTTTTPPPTTTTTTPTPTCTNVTPSTFASAVSAASSGDTLCLSAGNYGTWTGTNKAITVKGSGGASMDFEFTTGDQSFTVDGVTNAGGSITNGANNITIRNSTFNGHLVVDCTAAGSGILLDHNDHSTNSPSGAPNGMVVIFGGGVTVENSTFHDGDSDGIHIDPGSCGGNRGGADVVGNTFRNLCDTGGNHTDAIQFQGADGGRIAGNLIYADFNCPTQAITSFDSGTHGVVIEDNVVDVRRPWGIEFYSDDSSIIRHNTVVYHDDAGCFFTNLTCGKIDLTSKTVDPPGVGTEVYDNVAVVEVNRATVARNDHNVNPATVQFVGPPGVYDNYHLAPGSPGKGAASDGLDVGIR